jgi:hypothetical protein
MKTLHPKFYAALWSMNDEGCQNTLKGHITFGAIKSEMDPNRLAILMKEMIERGEVGAPQLQMDSKLRAQAEFHAFHQTHDMTCADFKTRYGELRDTQISHGEVLPLPAEDAEIFLRKLDPGRFSGMQTQLDNQAMMGTPKPATVDAMYNLAANWRQAARLATNKRSEGDLVFGDGCQRVGR